MIACSDAYSLSTICFDIRMVRSMRCTPFRYRNCIPRIGGRIEHSYVFHLGLERIEHVVSPSVDNGFFEVIDRPMQ
jgi:hypothetical protein